VSPAKAEIYFSIGSRSLPLQSRRQGISTLNASTRRAMEHIEGQ
jgi:hypothetical protein